MKRLTSIAGLLIAAVACSDSGASGELTYDYVYNSVDQQFHKNTLQGGELIASDVITADEYDRESGSELSAAQIQRAAWNSLCGLEAGDYVLEYAVLDDSCNIGPLQSELVSLSAGTLVQRSLPASDGCEDELVTQGCTASIRRRCETSTLGGMLSFDLTIAIDTRNGSGTATVRGIGNEPWGASDGSCSSFQRVSLERID